MRISPHVYRARYQLAPFGSPEKIVMVAWLLLILLFFIPPAYLPTTEQAAEKVVRMLTQDETSDACQLCYVVLHNVDVTQRTYMDVTATDFESYLDRFDQQLLVACKADPDERGCDTLRAKVDEELRLYTNVILEQMLGVSTVLEQYGSGLLIFLDDHGELIRRYVSGNNDRTRPTSHQGPRTEAVRSGMGKRYVQHMWLQDYPSAPIHHSYCSELCEGRVPLLERPRLYFWRFYVLHNLRRAITWIQQEHFYTYLVVTAIGGVTTVLLRRLLAPIPTYPGSSALTSPFAIRTASEQQNAVSGGGGTSSSGHHNSGSTSQSLGGRSSVRGKIPNRRR